MTHPWLFSLLSIYPERLELPVCLGSTQPGMQMLAAERNPGLEALSPGGSLPPRRGVAGMRGTLETCSESQQGQC